MDLAKYNESSVKYRVALPVDSFSHLSLSLTMKIAVMKKRIPPSTSTPVLVSREYCMAAYWI